MNTTHGRQTAGEVLVRRRQVLQGLGALPTHITVDGKVQTTGSFENITIGSDLYGIGQCAKYLVFVGYYW